ncbi:hypothetical protein IB276_33425 [Ensifer sp. ENS04]|nr:hypothetical protein [Ensifer sp. ENS04]
MRHPKVQERRELSAWSEGQVWGSPERPRIMKAQIDWIPLSVGSICATQGKSLGSCKSGGSQSFDAINTLRLPGRWMRMITIPKRQSPRPIRSTTEMGV